MPKRTQISFRPTGDVWPLIEGWASANGFLHRASPDSGKLYQKGIGFWVAPTMLSIHQENGTLALEIWIRCNLFTRAASFFILPAEMGIESGGFKAALPRKLSRDVVNRLLQQLGQPLIP
jgi:hypothetical protein